MTLNECLYAKDGIENLSKNINYCICRDHKFTDTYYISLFSVAIKFYPERIVC